MNQQGTDNAVVGREPTATATAVAMADRGAGAGKVGVGLLLSEAVAPVRGSDA
ncbi:hypothetical protein ACQEVY_30595 [Streptomyces sp. CA-288835]|uniref:hypothetical protein n=1 Tax=Streptomyces sp. CA-288835 TaxID=3240069 RepID=UPI003D8D11AE